MRMRVAQVQMKVTDNKTENLNTDLDWCQRLKQQDIDIVCFPEMFNCPYERTQFPEYTEPEQAETWQFLSKLSRENHWYVVGGSIPENSSGRFYNTNYTFNRAGEQISKPRMVHLFDIDIVNGQRFMESEHK
jgi:omega-amidase